MTTLRKVVALLCIGLVVFAAFVPAAAVHVVAVVLAPIWALFLPPSPGLVRLDGVRVVEQAQPLTSPLFSRPPPLA